jgi:hypothetical protein
VAHGLVPTAQQHHRVTPAPAVARDAAALNVKSDRELARPQRVVRMRSAELTSEER